MMQNEMNQGTWAGSAAQTAGPGMNGMAAGSWTGNGNPAGDIWQQNPSGCRPAPVPGPVETEETRRFRENYSFFALVAFLYALFYAFCIYKNGSGITFPFFVGGGLLFLCLSLPKLGLTLKKGSVFYMAACILLGISTFCTDDGRIIFFNKTGIFLLFMSLLLKQFYDMSKWKLGKCMGSILVMVCACIGELGRPFTDGRIYRKNHPSQNGKKLWAAAIGLLIAVPLFMIVLMLLSDADIVFRQITEKFLDTISFGSIMNVMFRVAFIFFASYALLSYLCGRTLREDVKDRRTGEPVTAITVTGLLTLLYLMFSGIQIAGLFLRQLKLPEGYTYTMYAREGFFQLLTVGFINLVIVLVCISFFRESRILKGILTVMSLCTFIMIASSTMRMIIYIHYFYLTFLRLLVLWGLALLTLLFAGIVANIFMEDFPLFRYSVAVVTVLYILLSFSRPDYIIAKVNISNISQETEEAEQSADRDGGYSDYSYLSGLCADAAPVLVPYLQEQGYHMEAYHTKDPVVYGKEQYDYGSVGYFGDKAEMFGYYWMREIKESLQGLGIRTFNLSRYMAWKELEAAVK